MAMQFRYYGYYAGPGWTGGYYLPPGVDVAEYYNVDPKSGTDAAARAQESRGQVLKSSISELSLVYGAPTQN